MTMKELQIAIAELSPTELEELAEWFDTYRAQLWDKQIAQDIDSGRLQTLLDEANRDL